MNIAELFEVEAKKTAYTPHKNFQGVYLKHLVTGALTENTVSCHLVKVEPFCELKMHNHPQQLEIHEVILGSGVYRTTAKEIPYRPGTVEIIPQNTDHQVTAGKDGLYILAKFIPALL
ncbi:MAG: hypothetical protein LBR56_09300 [Sporomusaceae bacterium]|nr:hypothetical protein [Sporomusaceae bacterium]